MRHEARSAPTAKIFELIKSVVAKRLRRCDSPALSGKYWRSFHGTLTNAHRPTNYARSCDRESRHMNMCEPRITRTEVRDFPRVPVCSTPPTVWTHPRAYDPDRLRRGRAHAPRPLRRVRLMRPGCSPRADGRKCEGASPAHSGLPLQQVCWGSRGLGPCRGMGVQNRPTEKRADAALGVCGWAFKAR